MAPATLAISEYCRLAGTELGCSNWILVDQARIDAFANSTLDRQFIHVDPERARESPFGGTIAHGLLTLSLLSAMAYDTLPAVQATKMLLNYGFNTVRFLAPVASGSRVRGRFALKTCIERSAGQWQSTLGATVEIEAEAKPALIAEWLTLLWL